MEESKRPEKRQKTEHLFEGSFTLRSYDPVKDLDAAAQAAYEAFKATGKPCDFTNAESVKDLFRFLSASKDNNGVVAVDSNGKILGSNFVEMCDSVAGIGPLSVVPFAQKHQVGTELLQHVMKLVKARSTVKSLCVSSPVEAAQSKLLASVGTKQFLEVADMRGFIPATTSLPRGYHVRVMTANDLYACDGLVSAALGFSRKNRLLSSLKVPLPRFVVLHEDEDTGRRVVGFTTGLSLSGFTIAENEDALKSLIITYSQSYEHLSTKRKDEGGEDASADDKGDGPSVVVQVISQYDSLAKWLTEQGFKIHCRRCIGVSGKIQQPKLLFVPCFYF